MPHIQELHAQIKDQQDTLVLTLNLDNNIGLVEPALSQEGENLIPCSPGSFTR